MTSDIVNDKQKAEAWKLAIVLSNEFIESYPFYKKQNIQIYELDKKGKKTECFTKKFKAIHDIYYPIAYDKIRFNIKD